MTNAPAAQIFDAQVAGYDAARRRLIPPFDQFYGTAVDALGLCRPAPERILDLGSGTGLLAGWIRAAYPAAQLTLVDGAGRMLKKARELLGDTGTTYLHGDLTAALPEGPWDAIVSALAIHHLTAAQKRDLFARVRSGLRPGGVFVNAEQVAGADEYFTGVYAAWHEARARTAGSDDQEWLGAEQRMSFDRCESVESQLVWLRDAGFSHADCLFKDHRFAVMVAL